MTEENSMRRIHKEITEKEKGYRAKALKLFPHICASCGREFSGPKLKELTVHHKDHNHQNNPPNGSNWELLCIYCHDHEHEKYKMKGYASSTIDKVNLAGFSSLEGLDDLIALKKMSE